MRSNPQGRALVDNFEIPNKTEDHSFGQKKSWSRNQIGFNTTLFPAGWSPSPVLRPQHAWPSGQGATLRSWFCLRAPDWNVTSPKHKYAPQTNKHSATKKTYAPCGSRSRDRGLIRPVRCQLRQWGTCARRQSRHSLLFYRGDRKTINAHIIEIFFC